MIQGRERAAFAIDALARVREREEEKNGWIFNVFFIIRRLWHTRIVVGGPAV